MTEKELAAEVARLRRQRNDDQKTEAKSCAGGLSTDVWESVAAFANTSGGLILLGLDENQRFSPAKGFELSRVCNAFVEGMGDGAAHGVKLTNPPRYQLERVGFEGKQVLCIAIEELGAALKPCYITAKGVVGGSYKRIDDKDIRLSPAEIYELQNFSLSAQSDRTPVPGSAEDDLMPDAVDAYLSRMAARASKALRGEQTRDGRLRSLGITTREGELRLAGLLCFGNYPQGYYPKLTVDVAVLPGNRKADGGTTRFLDRAVCEGTVAEVLDEAVAATVRNLRTVSTIEGLGRREEPEIPLVVLREALTNALLHREYAPQFLGQAVSVEVYPNRVEILSPGGLWGGKTLDNISDGTSRCRNDLLMAFVSNLPLQSGDGAPAEGQGSGIALMEREMEMRGLPAPRFEAGFDYFKIVFARAENGTMPPSPSRHAGSSTTGEILALYEDNPSAELSARGIAEALNLTLSATRARLKRLVEAGALEPTAPPTDKSRRYRLPR